MAVCFYAFERAEADARLVSVARADEQCVRLGAVRHVVNVLSVWWPKRIASVESAGAHVESAHHCLIVSRVRDE